VSVFTDRDSNDDHVEGDRDDRRELVDRKSVLVYDMFVVGGITMSISTNGPLPEQRDPMTVERSAMVYKIAESITTRMILVVMTFVVREVETLRSIFQMRYASSPVNKSTLA
jgi:hypothetical protein